jgi:uncharacterized membrane protein
MTTPEYLATVPRQPHRIRRLPRSASAAGTRISVPVVARAAAMKDRGSGYPVAMSITESIDVAVPVSAAYTQWTDFESFPTFMEGVESVRKVDDTHLDWAVKVGRTSRRFRAKILEQTPNQRISWQTETGARHAGVITFEPLDDTHTRITAEMDIDPATFTELVADRVGVLGHRVKDDMTRFKDVVEQRQPGPH